MTSQGKNQQGADVASRVGGSVGGTAAAAAAAPIPGLQAEDHHQGDDEQQDDGVAGPLPGVLLVLPGGRQLLRAAPHVRVGPRHVALDVVQLLPLSLHQHGHVQEHLVQLIQVPLQVLDGVVSLLDLFYGVQDSSPPLLLDCLLQERLALP